MPRLTSNYLRFGKSEIGHVWYRCKGVLSKSFIFQVSYIFNFGIKSPINTKQPTEIMLKGKKLVGKESGVDTNLSNLNSPA